MQDRYSFVLTNRALLCLLISPLLWFNPSQLHFSCPFKQNYAHLSNFTCQFQTSFSLLACLLLEFVFQEWMIIQQFRAPAVSAEDLSLLPSTHVRKFSTASRTPSASGLLRHLDLNSHSYMHPHMYTCSRKEINFNSSQTNLGIFHSEDFQDHIQVITELITFALFLPPVVQGKQN